MQKKPSRLGYIAPGSKCNELLEPSRIIKVYDDIAEIWNLPLFIDATAQNLLDTPVSIIELFLYFRELIGDRFQPLNIPVKLHSPK